MADTTHESFEERLWKQLIASQSFDPVDKVREYFGRPGSSEGVPFDGAAFETFGRAWSDNNQVTPADLVAVTLLSMEIRRNSRSGISTDAALRIEADSGRIATILSRIPTDRELWTLSGPEYERWVGPGSPSDLLWTYFRSECGLGPVATFKLLARKRPELLPIRDSATAAALGSTNRWWESWWRALSSSPDLRGLIGEIRSDAGVEHLSLLRTADIVIWQRRNEGAATQI
jgi:hypothetical protein